MQTKSDNITTMRGVENEDIINEYLFVKDIKKDQKQKLKGTSFTFERIVLLKYHLHKINLNRGSSYIQSPDWMKNKGVTINSKKY